MFRSFASTASALTLTAIGSLVMLSGAKPAQAQSNVVYSANIPFAFQMNDVSLPAGEYQITQISPHNLRLSAMSGKKQVQYVAVYPGDDARSQRAQIRFTRYGDRNFLRDFAAAPNGSLRSVSRCPVTRGEKQTAKDWVQTRQTFTTVAMNVYPQH
jgi:hypothetical protein